MTLVGQNRVNNDHSRRSDMILKTKREGQHAPREGHKQVPRYRECFARKPRAGRRESTVLLLPLLLLLLHVHLYKEHGRQHSFSNEQHVAYVQHTSNTTARRAKAIAERTTRHDNTRQHTETTYTCLHRKGPKRNWRRSLHEQNCTRKCTSNQT